MDRNKGFIAFTVIKPLVGGKKKPKQQQNKFLGIFKGTQVLFVSSGGFELVVCSYQNPFLYNLGIWNRKMIIGLCLAVGQRYDWGLLDGIF